jgi:transmembrane sensor
MATDANIENNKNNDRELAKFLEQLGSAKVPKGRSKDEAWSMLVRQIGQKEQEEKKTLHLPVKTILAVAASLIILFGSWAVFKIMHTQTFSATNGQTAHIELPDKSYVELSAGTTIQYRPYKWEKRRHVQIEGEAFFSVIKGKEFVVESNGNKITVKGTTFNVYARYSRFDVQCFSGKVLVETPSVKPVLLEKGHAIKTTENKSVCDTFSFNPEQPVSWMKGEFNFNNENLNIVFEELERQFNVSISVPEFKDRYYSGYFNRSDLKAALNNICLPMALEYKLVDSTHVEIKE